MTKEEIEEVGFKYDPSEESCMAFVQGIWDLWYYPDTHKMVIESEETGVVFDGEMKTQQDLVMFIHNYNYNPVVTRPETVYDKFMEQYEKDHAACPKCGSEDHTTTLVGYAFDESKPEDYKDRNRCTCMECKDVHIMHDRIPKAEGE